MSNPRLKELDNGQILLLANETHLNSQHPTIRNVIKHITIYLCLVIQKNKQNI